MGDLDGRADDTRGILRIYSDDRKLSPILRNFISNALKFTLEGEVRVTARLLDDGRIEFAVTATGTGIAEEHLPTLFADFAQVDTRVQKRLRGTGLGLSLARNSAHLLGGSVGAASTEGKGSRFYHPCHYPGTA